LKHVIEPILFCFHTKSLHKTINIEKRYTKTVTSRNNLFYSIWNLTK
jgi:hypothetical protein